MGQEVIQTLAVTQLYTGSYTASANSTGTGYIKVRDENGTVLKAIVYASA